MLTPLSNRPATPFPNEIFQAIFRYLPQSQLCEICALSRTFHEEVVGALYQQCELIHITIDQFISWASLLVIRTDLARMVRTLILPGLLHDANGFLGQNLDQLEEVLPRTLKSLNNLKSLLIEPHFLEDSSCSSAHYLNGEHFLGCRFRLTTFRNSFADYWTPDTLLPFLIEQKEIQDLKLDPDYEEPEADLNGLLPKLSIVHTVLRLNSPSKPIVGAIASRQLTRLKLHLPSRSIDDIRDAIQMFSSAGTTLMYFDIHMHARSWLTGETHRAQVLEIISSTLPNIRFLRYSVPFAIDVCGCLYSAVGLTHKHPSQTLGGGSRFRRSFPNSNTLRCWLWTS